MIRVVAGIFILLSTPSAFAQKADFTIVKGEVLQGKLDFALTVKFAKMCSKDEFAIYDLEKKDKHWFGILHKLKGSNCQTNVEKTYTVDMLELGMIHFWNASRSIRLEFGTEDSEGNFHSLFSFVRSAYPDRFQCFMSDYKIREQADYIRYYVCVHYLKSGEPYFANYYYDPNPYCHDEHGDYRHCPSPGVGVNGFWGKLKFLKKSERGKRIYIIKDRDEVHFVFPEKENQLIRLRVDEGDGPQVHEVRKMYESEKSGIDACNFGSEVCGSFNPKMKKENL